jgi:CheY-like chemotaxis protein/two-component sensor histidine kinase
MMERQVHHLVRLVDDLLDVSRVMRGKIELRKEPVDLAAIAARAVETAQPLIQARGHDLSVRLPDRSLPLEADPVRLSQVVGNLLANAAKYTEPGGQIDLSARLEGSEAVLEVRDTGIGLAPEIIPRIFDLFVQAGHASERSQGGLGIGLTLARSLVELHGGTIEARSAGAGRGSTFVVRLPAGAPGGVAPEGAVGDDARPDAAARRLLVVDDNQDAANSLGMLLRLQGHEVRVAYDGASALAIAPEYRPEIAFLDIGMPGMDGHELARRLREDPAASGLMLVAVTGWGTPEDRRRTADAGFDHHLVKPVDLEALARLLHEGPLGAVVGAHRRSTLGGATSF